MQQPTHPPDIAALEDGFDGIERDARALVTGLTEFAGAWRPDPDGWTVAECLDHLAIANHVYLGAMQPPAEEALARGARRRGPAHPGVLGRWFVRTLEPPVTSGSRRAAPEVIRPRHAPPLDDATGQFLASHNEVRAFLRHYADIDLAGTRFANPFVRGIRFSLATGLHVIAAHERRHVWQAWRVRDAAERAAA
jgi:hypothetical protein